MNGARILGFGSRDWYDRALVGEVLLREIERRFPGVPFRLIELIEGGAGGADTCFKSAGTMLGLTVRTVRPDYVRHHKKQAPLIRNTRMADMFPDLAIGALVGRTNGSMDMLGKLVDRGVETLLIPRTAVLTRQH